MHEGKPFRVRTKTADEILAKVKRFGQRTVQVARSASRCPNDFLKKSKIKGTSERRHRLAKRTEPPCCGSATRPLRKKTPVVDLHPAEVDRGVTSRWGVALPGVASTRGMPPRCGAEARRPLRGAYGYRNDSGWWVGIDWATVDQSGVCDGNAGGDRDRDACGSWPAYRRLRRCAAYHCGLASGPTSMRRPRHGRGLLSTNAGRGALVATLMEQGPGGVCGQPEAAGSGFGTGDTVEPGRKYDRRDARVLADSLRTRCW